MTPLHLRCGDCGLAVVKCDIRAAARVPALCAGCAFWKGLDHGHLVVPDLAIDSNVYIIDPFTDELTDNAPTITMFDGTPLGQVRRLRCLGVECGAAGRPPANAIVIRGRQT